MKVSKTYLELFKFNQVAGAYLEKHKGSENKLCASINNFCRKQLVKIFEEYNDLVDVLQLNNCSVDPVTKVILLKDSIDGKGQVIRNRQYTVDAEIKLKKESKELLNQSVEIHCRIPEGIENLLSELTEEEKEVFSGIVIPEQIESEDESKQL